ncbi:P-loop containing nucleoside triphosphate hydrolase protein [Xylariaceae sp. FL0594]|nr:P-loop containing nucleoside triphosphate hydrolase protein [Xylariaceae sp. FL0594]
MPGLTFSPKPIFLVTHPRACSTAFERVFLTRVDDIECVHEPFSDAYHWGPEKLTERYENVEQLRAEKGYGEYTYRAALDRIEEAKSRGKRVFVKDMGKCLLPLHGDKPWIAPSLRPWAGAQDTGAAAANDTSSETSSSSGSDYDSNKLLLTPNATVVPLSLLSGFHYTFLIRDPRKAIPSLWECSTPPKSHMTGWHGFKAEDAGYGDLRRLFEYLFDAGLIGPGTGNEICVVDADDLLTHPEDVVRRFCDAVDVPFDKSMLRWESQDAQRRAREAFKNWAPFHDAVLKSTSLRAHPKMATSLESDLAKWREKYGEEGCAIIRKNVEDNMEHYLYLKQFAIRPTAKE